ncbi:Arylesterase [Emticicia oligotrophica DSM 17448]|uniref:Arylesterase n=1 Tax=Emticicia oligotrophica (strain DSM 17448 / CIP 109782 / MTCC 6937 / GPTSA100-15) TaxID=929562 RepID=A0ABM5MXJ3_EMTOG|nr:SMP-30/gluconolactonase/LRE family protein [Emticicia oligotrophica]AFK01845.1 Arylesterase [Emticicia oligotrophica DSM 17448]
MKLWLKISLGLFAILIVFIGKTLYNAGAFKAIEPHFNGVIAEVNGFTGAEDITIDDSKGLALISSNNFRDASKRGAIFLLNLKEANPKPINLTDKLGFDFHPHGISLYKSIDGQKRLFVVNHRQKGNYIEVFDFTDSTLNHLESISSSLFVSPNDVTAVGEHAFYVTNDHDEPKSSWRDKKDLLQVPMGNVCYYDGQRAKIVADGFLYANGITPSLDGRQIFVAATSGRKIKVYDRDFSTGKLTESDEIMIDGADNIELDEYGHLWVGCHPKLLAFLGHSKDHSKLSPSEIKKIMYRGKGDFTVESIYLNDGKPVSGSSVGAVWGDKLLIGTVFENKILVATIKK